MSGDVGLGVSEGVGEETRVEEAVSEREELGGERGNARDSCRRSWSTLRSVEDEDLHRKEGMTSQR